MVMASIDNPSQEPKRTANSGKQKPRLDDSLKKVLVANLPPSLKGKKKLDAFLQKEMGMGGVGELKIVSLDHQARSLDAKAAPKLKEIRPAEAENMQNATKKARAEKLEGPSLNDEFGGLFVEGLSVLMYLFNLAFRRCIS